MTISINYIRVKVRFKTSAHWLTRNFRTLVIMSFKFYKNFAIKSLIKGWPGWPKLSNHEKLRWKVYKENKRQLLKREILSKYFKCSNDNFEKITLLLNFQTDRLTIQIIE